MSCKHLRKERRKKNYVVPMLLIFKILWKRFVTLLIIVSSKIRSMIFIGTAVTALAVNNICSPRLMKATPHFAVKNVHFNPEVELAVES